MGVRHCDRSVQPCHRRSRWQACRSRFRAGRGLRQHGGNRAVNASKRTGPEDPPLHDAAAWEGSREPGREHHAADPVRQDLGPASDHDAGGRPGSPVRRPPLHPRRHRHRLRHAAPARAEAPRAAPHLRHAGPLRPDPPARHGGDQPPRAPRHDPGAGARRGGVRHHPVRPRRPAPGHRPCGRAGTRLEPAGHDHRLRRQPHLDPWRARRAGLRHRRHRGRARAGDPVAVAAPAAAHARLGRRRAGAGRDRQGHHPGDHRRDRRGRCCRPCPGICRQRDPGAVDGRPPDGLQHVDRGRRPGRHDRAGRHHLRLSGGSTLRTAGRRLGPSGGAMAGAAIGR